MKDKLKEISGLAAGEGNLVYAHNDEKGKIFEVNIDNGQITREFSLKGKKTDRDYEGIARSDSNFYMVDNSGALYSFRLAGHKKKLKYKSYKTILSSRYNVEGLCYDPVLNQLLLACKNYPGKKHKGMRAIYSFDLSSALFVDEPRVLLKISDVVNYDQAGFLNKLQHLLGLSDDLTFEPSGIEWDSETGHFLIIAANGRWMIEITRNGQIVDRIRLDHQRHKQPEGITITTSGKLVISDEGVDGPGKLTVYDIISK